MCKEQIKNEMSLPENWRDQEMYKRYKYLIAGYMVEHNWLDIYIDKFIENFEKNFIDVFTTPSFYTRYHEIPGYDDPLTLNELEEYLKYRESEIEDKNILRFRLAQLESKNLINFFEFKKKGGLSEFYVFKRED